MSSYCQTLFNPKESFAFWNDKQFKDTCVLMNVDKLLKRNKDACAALNEHMFEQYKKHQQTVLMQLEISTKGNLK